MRNTTIIGVAIFFLLVLGGIFAWNSLSAPDTETNTTAMSSASPQEGIGGGPGMDLNQTTIDESAGLNALFQDHAINASFHLQDLYDGKDTAGSSGKLQENAIKVADFFNQKIGLDKNEFLEMWDGHIREYENYTRALKSNDQNGKAQAKEALNMQSMHMGQMINQRQPNLPASEVERLMNEHVDLTLSVIEAYAAGDNTTKLAQATKASTQAVAFADKIIDAIEGETTPSPTSTTVPGI